MKNLLCVVWFSSSTALIALSCAPLAVAEELLTYNQITASTDADYQCQRKVKVRLDTDYEDRYRKSRIDVQNVSKTVKTYLWLECKELETIEFEAYASGKSEPVYRASTSREDGWFLKEESLADDDKPAAHDNDNTAKEKPASHDKKPSPAVQPDPKSVPSPSVAGKKTSSSYQDLESLEAAAKKSDKAKLELAKGLLDLPGKPEAIDFPDDGERGLKMLEELAAAGNEDATHILGQAYAQHKQFDFNIPLLEKLTGEPFNPADTSREEVEARLTMEAAADGSKLALDALQEAGASGSHHAYYAMGMMYMLDKPFEMPYEENFLKGTLDMDQPIGSGSGNVDVGLHFLTLAAEAGNADAGELLTDLDIQYRKPAKKVKAKTGKTRSSNTAKKTQTRQSSTTSKSRATNSSANSAATSAVSASIRAGAPTAGSGMAAGTAVATSTGGSPSSSAASSTSSGSATAAGSNATSGLVESGVLSSILDARSRASSASSSAAASSIYQSGSGTQQSSSVAASVSPSSGSQGAGSQGASSGRGSAAGTGRGASSSQSATVSGSRAGSAGAGYGAGQAPSSKHRSPPNGNKQPGSHSAQNTAEIID